jgi:hypothetical protein
VFAVTAAGGGVRASFQSNVKASVFITSVSFAIYVAARLAGPLVRDRRRREHPPISRTDGGACHDPQQTARPVPFHERTLES